MTLLAFILLMAAAFVHVSWNYISKKERPSQVFFIMATLTGVVLMLPALFYFRAQIAEMPLGVWRNLVITGFFMALYYVALAAAYRHGDMSLAYPLARSVPVLLIALLNLATGHGGEIGGWALAGMVLVFVGCLALPLRRFGDWHPRDYRSAVCGMALLAAIGSAGYMTVDSAAIAMLRLRLSSTHAAIIYLGLQAITSALWQAVFLAARPAANWTQLRARMRTQWKTAVLAGCGIFIAYGLTLAAMAYVRNVSYVAAFRQLGIPIGAAAGIFLLGEPAPTPRIIGVIAVLAGLVLVGVG